MRLLAILVVLAAPVHASAQPGSWSTRSDAPVELLNAASCSDGRHAYAWGGSGGPTAHHRYDPVADAWSALAELPTPVYNAAGCSLDGVNWSFGNSTGRFGIVLRYDPAADRWEEAGTCPHAYRAAAATDGRSILLLGGYAGGRYSGAFSRFDPSTGRYEELPPIEGAALNGPGLAFRVRSGTWFATHASSCWEFDGAWTGRTGPPAPRQLHAMLAAPNGRIYLLGGTQGTRVDEYQPRFDSWETREPAPSAHSSRPGAAVLEGAVFLWGGGAALDRFEWPRFGVPPDPASDACWTGTEGHAGAVIPGSAGPVTFSARVYDADDGDELRWVVQVRPPGGGWGPDLGSAWGPPGARSVLYDPTASGLHAWRHRAEDGNGNSSGWEEEDPFLVDLDAPGSVTLLAPLGIDVPVDGPAGGRVGFSWIPAAGGDRTEIEISAEPIRRYLARGTELHVELPVGRHVIHWKARAVDDLGNVGPWSSPASFRVVHDDGVDHGAGDGLACQAGGRQGVPLLLLVLLIPIIHVLRNSHWSRS